MITKLNTYLPGQNLTNLALNVDYDRIGQDLSDITVNFGTTPATVTIKLGSIIEANGNRYIVETADYVFQMSNAAHNYIKFDGTTFSSAATRGTFNTAKQGYYQSDNISRTIHWYIDQTNSKIYREMEYDNYRFYAGGTFQPDSIVGGLGLFTKVQILQGTALFIGGNGVATINLPSGWNDTNTIIMSVALKARLYGTTDAWISYSVDTGALNTVFPLEYIAIPVGSSTIVMQCGSVVSPLYRIVIARID